MATRPTPCPVCSSSAKIWDNGGGPNVECKRCGKFKVADFATAPLEQFDPVQRAYLSAWIREHPGITIYEKDLSFLSALQPPSVGEKADLLLIYLGKECPKAGTPIHIGIFIPSLTYFEEGSEPTRALANDGQLFAITWTQDAEELRFILDDYLGAEKGFVREVESGAYKITARGWAHLDSLKSRNSQSGQSFIAMWFDPQVNEAWKAIDEGIRAAGFTPLRIDQKQHNNEITDEMIAEIRKSRFLVADLTGHRHGVYYEAGFAKGFGIGVIWLCRKDELKNAHFDVNHFPMIVWEGNKLEELSKALQLRIEATIGRGPLPASA